MNFQGSINSSISNNRENHIDRSSCSSSSSSSSSNDDDNNNNNNNNNVKNQNASMPGWENDADRVIQSHVRSISEYGDLAKAMNLNLPFFKAVKLPPGPEEVPILPTLMNEACGGKIITGGLLGAIMGIGLGIFMGAMGDVSPIEVRQGREVPQAPLREQIRAGFKATTNKAKGWGKGFGVMTALFGGVECIIEKHRGKHDVWNPVLSGCVVGATLSASGGPASACAGCVGFAGFSLLIDKVMGEH